MRGRRLECDAAHRDLLDGHELHERRIVLGDGQSVKLHRALALQRGHLLLLLLLLLLLRRLNLHIPGVWQGARGHRLRSASALALLPLGGAALRHLVVGLALALLDGVSHRGADGAARVLAAVVVGQDHAARQAVRHGAALVLAGGYVRPQLLDARAEARHGACAVRVRAFVRMPKQEKPLLLLPEHLHPPLLPNLCCGWVRA